MDKASYIQVILTLLKGVSSVDVIFANRYLTLGFDEFGGVEEVYREEAEIELLPEEACLVDLGEERFYRLTFDASMDAGILWSVLSPRVTCKLNKLDFIRELNEKGQTSGGF